MNTRLKVLKTLFCINKTFDLVPKSVLTTFDLVKTLKTFDIVKTLKTFDLVKKETFDLVKFGQLTPSHSEQLRSKTFEVYNKQRLLGSAFKRRLVVTEKRLSRILFSQAQGSRPVFKRSKLWSPPSKQVRMLFSF